jgi:hypothetical protein
VRVPVTSDARPAAFVRELELLELARVDELERVDELVDQEHELGAQRSALASPADPQRDDRERSRRDRGRDGNYKDEPRVHHRIPSSAYG